MKRIFITAASAFAFLASAALAQEGKIGGQVGEMSLSADDVGLFKKRSYSPYAGRSFPTQVFWGDTHLHTETD